MLKASRLKSVAIKKEVVNMDFFNFLALGAILIIIACVLWIATQAVWLRMQGNMRIKQQDALMDAAYSKLVRLYIRARNDIRSAKRGDING